MVTIFGTFGLIWYKFQSTRVRIWWLLHFRKKFEEQQKIRQAEEEVAKKKAAAEAEKVNNIFPMTRDQLSIWHTIATNSILD